MRKKLVRLLSILLVCSSLLVGCKGKAELDNKDETLIEEEELVAVEGGEIVLPLIKIKSLNPMLIENSHYYHFSKLMFENLFEFGDDLKPSPKLVKDYSISGNIIKLKLRDDVYFHDGNRLTAKDVAFSLDVIKAAGINNIYGRMINDALGKLQIVDLNNIITYEIIDDASINIIFDKEYGNALEALTFPIIQSANFDNNVENALIVENYRPVGTGPYQFVRMDNNKLVELEKNTEHWDGAVYIDKIVGKILESEDSIKSSYETGQLNMAISDGVDWDKYSQNSRIKIFEFPSPVYEFLAFNFQNPLMQGENGVLLRQAIMHSIDRENIAKRVYLGHATLVDSPLHPSSFLNDINEDNSYEFNKNKAKRILEKLGYVNSNEEGILLDEAGNPLELRLLTNSYSPYRNLAAELITQDLKDVGIKLVADYETDYFNNMKDEKIENQWNLVRDKMVTGNFDIVYAGWDTSSIVDITNMFHSSKIGGDNFTRYSNEKLDQLLEGINNKNSEDYKAEEYKKIIKILYEDLPYISLYYRNDGLLVDKKIIGDLNPSFFNLYNGINKCFIKEKDA